MDSLEHFGKSRYFNIDEVPLSYTYPISICVWYVLRYAGDTLKPLNTFEIREGYGGGSRNS